jgi:hypothetical protein
MQDFRYTNGLWPNPFSLRLNVIKIGGYPAPKRAKAPAVSVRGNTPPLKIFDAKIHLN